MRRFTVPMKVGIMLLSLLVFPCFRTVSAADPCQNCNCLESPWPPKCNSCCIKVRGKIVRSNKDTSSFTILSKGGVEKTVTYDESTKWVRHGVAAAAEFDEGAVVVVYGKREHKGGVLAKQILVQKR